jgi:Ser/Thr protein kinase RdoA (MazF antagonist)
VSAAETLETTTVARWLAQAWNLSGATVEPHHGGMNSRTWFVAAGDARFVAKAVPITAGAQFSAGLAVAAQVEAAGIPAGAPVLTTDGGSSITRDGWTLALLTFVAGDGLTGNSDHDNRLIGATLARAHLALAGPEFPDAKRFHWLDPDADHLGIRAWIRPAIVNALADWERLPPSSLSWGLLHSDPAPEAFRYDVTAGVCGIIDWDRALVGPRMYDLASAVMYVGPRRSGPLVEEYVGHGGLGRDEVERALLPLLRLRFAVQADYFASRISTNDMTGIGDASENKKGLEDARQALIDGNSATESWG